MTASRLFFCPGLGCKGQDQFAHYSGWFPTSWEVCTVDFPEVTHGWRFINVAGENDRQCLFDALGVFLRRAVRDNATVVLMGVSRGATCLYMVLDWYNQFSPNLLHPIQCVILEAPYTSLAEVRMRDVSWVQKVQQTLLHYLGPWVTRYHPRQSSLQIFKQYPTHIATMVVASQKDEVVTFRCIQDVAWNSDFTFVVLQKAPHRKYWNTPEDCKKYQQAVMNFLGTNCI